MRRIELHAGAWVEIGEGWLPASDAAALASALVRELAWEQRHIVLFGKPVLQPRLIAWAGELPYRYSGQTLEPRPWPSAVRTLATDIGAVAGAPFNHVLLNRYRDGTDSMGSTRTLSLSSARIPWWPRSRLARRGVSCCDVTDARAKSRRWCCRSTMAAC